VSIPIATPLASRFPYTWRNSSTRASARPVRAPTVSSSRSSSRPKNGA
jgi:hypothetical protein